MSKSYLFFSYSISSPVSLLPQPLLSPGTEEVHCQKTPNIQGLWCLFQLQPILCQQLNKITIPQIILLFMLLSALLRSHIALCKGKPSNLILRILFTLFSYSHHAPIHQFALTCRFCVRIKLYSKGQMHLAWKYTCFISWRT